MARIEVGDEDEEERLKELGMRICHPGDDGGVPLGDSDDSRGGGGAPRTTALTVDGMFFWLAGVGGEG